MRQYEQTAADFAQAIRDLCADPDKLSNLESYLSQHFDIWMKKYASTPDGLTSELRFFADM